MAEEDLMIVYEITDVNDEPTSMAWTHESTITLLESYKKYKFLLIKFKVKVVFELISIKLKSFGIEKSSVECNKKIHNLIRSYRSCLQKDSRHEKFLYFDEIREILKAECVNNEILQENDKMELLEIEKKLGLNQIRSNQCEGDDFNKFGSLKTWTNDATHALLELYQSYKTLFANHKSISVFEFLSEKLLQTNGISKRPADIQRKFNNLVRTFKICSKKSSNKHQRFYFFDAMKEILNTPAQAISTSQNEMIEQEYQRFEMNKNEAKPVPINSFAEWNDEELLNLVCKYLEQLTEDQINWDVISRHQNDNLKTANECQSTIKHLLLDFKAIFHFEVDHSFSYISELQKAFVNEDELDQAISSLESEHDSTKVHWTSAETIKLIELYQQHNNLFKKQKKTVGWDHLAKQLHEAGFPLRSYKTIKQKFDNLKRTYKNVFENEAIYMIKTKKFKFYDSLKSIFGKYEEFWLNGGVDPVSEVEVEEVNNVELKSIKHKFFESKKRLVWSENETRSLIEEFGKVHELSATNNLWRDVTTSLRCHRVYRSAEETSKKWSNLLRTYKVCLKKYLDSGITPTKFPYFHDLREIFEKSAMREAEWALNEDISEVNDAEEDVEMMSEYIVDEISEVELLSKVNSKKLWSPFESTTLIKLTKAQQPNKINWSQVSRALRRRTILRTPVECRKKFTNIVRSYSIAKAKKELNDDAVINFKYFDVMHQTFGDHLPVIQRNCNLLSKETLVKVIDLKYQLSQQKNKACLSINQWRQLVQALKLNVTPEFLKFTYYNLLKKYKFLCKRNRSNEIQWFYYNKFDKYYGQPTVNHELEPETLVQEDFEAIHDSDSDENMQYLADNFMDICKICLEKNSVLNYIESCEKELINKLNFLFLYDSEEKLDLNVANLICNSCVEKVENFYTFKQRFNHAAVLLKTFSKTYTISSSEPEPSNQELDLASSVDMKPPDDIIIEEYQQLDNDEFDVESYVDEMDYSNFIIETLDEEKTEIPKTESLHTSLQMQKLFKCIHCDHVFKRLESCKSHMRKHFNLRNYKCHICSKTFISHQSLNKHQAVHNKGVVRYKCTECNSGFYRQAVYKRHLATHGIGLNHFCEVCSQGFLYISEKEEHKNCHSEDNKKPYQCDNCLKSFGMKRYLRAHIRQYHEKPEVCKSCFETFSTSFKLKEHTRNQHGIEEVGVVE